MKYYFWALVILITWVYVNNYGAANLLTRDYAGMLATTIVIWFMPVWLIVWLYRRFQKRNQP